jgi:hypothetical protein
MATPSTGLQLRQYRLAARIRSVPLGRVKQWPSWTFRFSLQLNIFIHLQVLTSGSRIANTNRSLQGVGMLGELTNIPTDTLIDMLYMILAGEVAITASDAMEIEQIQRELQRRDGAQNWSFATIH